jgi:sugar lactone lactonase YvrE
VSAAVDVKDQMWIAEWGTGRIGGYGFHGGRVQEVAASATRLTRPAFSGDNGQTLSVTSARFRLSPDERACPPYGGALFAIEPDVPGRREDRCGPPGGLRKLDDGRWRSTWKMGHIEGGKP